MQLFLTFKTIFPFSQRFVAVTSQWNLRPESIYLRSPSLNNARVLLYPFFSRQSLVCFFGPLVGTQSHKTTRTVCSTWHGSCRPALPRRHNKLKNMQYLQSSTMRLMQDSLFIYLSRNEGRFFLFFIKGFLVFVEVKVNKLQTYNVMGEWWLLQQVLKPPNKNHMSYLFFNG